MTFRIALISTLAALSATLVPGQEIQPTAFEVIYSFGSVPDGTNPQGAPVIAPSGKIYGYTPYGGNFLSGGTVFELTPPAVQGGAWTESVIHSFGGTISGSPDGVTPEGLLLAPSGDLFGITASGGPAGHGVVFELTPPAQDRGLWTETIISDTGSLGGLTLGAKGVLFGTSGSLVFELTPPAVAGSAWSKQTIYNFNESTSSASTLTLTSAGYLLGTLVGNTDPYVPATAFALAPPMVAGGAWTETTLSTFGIDQAESPLLISATGLFGTTFYGGAYASGMVYELTSPAAPGDPLTQTTLYSFPSSNTSPEGKIVFGKGDALYGTTAGNEFPQTGSVYALVPPAHPGGSWTFDLIHSFDGPTQGSTPLGGLSINAAGALFGFTSTYGPNGGGTAFVITVK